MRSDRAVFTLLLGAGTAALLLAGCGGSTPDIPDLGLSPQQTETLPAWKRFVLDRVLDYRVASGARAGFVAMVARSGRPVYARTTGMADLAQEKPMRLDTRFHLASMTKPVTAVAAMILVDDGRLSLDDPIDRYLPAFANPRVALDPGAPDLDRTRPPEGPTLVRHLLTMTSGIGGYAESDDPFDQAWRSPDIEDPGLGSLADRIERVSLLPRYEDPGKVWRYGWSFDVLARVVEVAAGEPFDAFLKRRLFAPLGMRDTGFADDLPAAATLATLYTHNEAGDLVPEPRFADYGVGWTPGGGGLISTAGDFMRFALMLAGGGQYGDVRILKTSTVAQMTRLQVPSGVLADMGIEGLGWGLGLCVVANEDLALMPGKNGDFWWSGRFGSHFWISPTDDTVVVVLQQTERGPFSDLPVTPSIVQAITNL